MANIQRMIPRIKPPIVVSNPYNLVHLQIGGQPVLGRPIAWNTEIVDHANLLDANGLPLVVTKVIVQCPQCNSGFEVLVPPFDLQCPYCMSVSVPVTIQDPFINPFESGIINFEALNLDLIATLSKLPDNTVADRFSCDNLV